MAWEQRGNNLYYYRKRRNGKRVSSEYVGSGPVVRLISDLDQEERNERKQTHVKWQRQKQEVKSIEAGLAQLNEMTMSLVRAALLTSGYHTHKRQWRRKRND